MVLRIYPGGKRETTSAAKAARGAERKQISAKAAEPAATPAPGGLTHPVQPGDTLWSLARAYGTTVEALKRANPFLAGHALRVGIQLRLPPPG